MKAALRNEGVFLAKNFRPTAGFHNVKSGSQIPVKIKHFSFGTAMSLYSGVVMLDLSWCAEEQFKEICPLEESTDPDSDNFSLDFISRRKRDFGIMNFYRTPARVRYEL